MDTLDHAFFYNSNDGDRIYDADSFSEWLRKFFTTGVFTGDLQVTAGGGMTLSVGSGYCNINGKVKMWRQPQSLTISPQSGQYNRVDSIVIERNDLERDFALKVVRGTSAASPRAPAPVRSGSVYQIVLAQVTVKTGSIAITAADIRDTRAVSSLCGIVAGTVKEIDFDQIQTQFDAWFDKYKSDFAAEYKSYQTQLQALLDQITTKGQGDLTKLTQELTDFVDTQTASFDSWYEQIKGQLSEDAAGRLQNQILDLYTIARDTTVAEIEIPPASWKSTSGEYATLGYTLQADIAVPGAKANKMAICNVLPSDYSRAHSFGLAPFVQTGDNTISFFAKSKPASVAIAVNVLLHSSGEITKRLLYRREEKGLLFDYYTDGSIVPAGETAPDTSIMTFEHVTQSATGDLAFDTKGIETLSMALTEEQNVIGAGKKVKISWTGNDAATAKFPDLRVRLATPKATELHIGLNISDSHASGVQFRLTLYSCAVGAALGSITKQYGQEYRLTPINDGYAHHYRISLSDFGINDPISVAEGETIELKIAWNNATTNDKSGDAVLIDNIGFFD